MYLTRDPRPNIRPPATDPVSDLSPTPINSSLLAYDMNDVESPVQTLKIEDETNRTGVDDLEASSVSFKDETEAGPSDTQQDSE